MGHSCTPSRTPGPPSLPPQGRRHRPWHLPARQCVRAKRRRSPRARPAAPQTALPGGAAPQVRRADGGRARGGCTVHGWDTVCCSAALHTRSSTPPPLHLQLVPSPRPPPPVLHSRCITLLRPSLLPQLLIVGDFNVPAEPRDMHPALGPFEQHYSAEEVAALRALTDVYPGVRCGTAVQTVGPGGEGGSRGGPRSPLPVPLVLRRTCNQQRMAREPEPRPLRSPLTHLPAPPVCPRWQTSGAACTPRRPPPTPCGTRRRRRAPSTPCERLAAGRQPVVPRQLSPAPARAVPLPAHAGSLSGLLRSMRSVRSHDFGKPFCLGQPLPCAPLSRQGLRIDYVLATPGLLERVVSCEGLSAEAIPPKWSDHAGGCCGVVWVVWGGWVGRRL